MTVSMFSAGFSDVDATLVSAGGGLELQGTVRVESFDVRDDALRAQVLAPAFLDAERHPELAFRSTAIRTDRDELRVAGELTIKGTTRTRDQVTDAIATGAPEHAADSARDTLGGAVGAADRLPTGLSTWRRRGSSTDGRSRLPPPRRSTTSPTRARGSSP